MASKTNRVEVPAAKAAMDRFKTEVASELGVNLKEGYNGSRKHRRRNGSSYDQEAGRADEISSAGILGIDRNKKEAVQRIPLYSFLTVFILFIIHRRLLCNLPGTWQYRHQSEDVLPSAL